MVAFSQSSKCDDRFASLLPLVQLLLLLFSQSSNDLIFVLLFMLWLLPFAPFDGLLLLYCCEFMVDGNSFGFWRVRFWSDYNTWISSLSLLNLRKCIYRISLRKVVQSIGHPVQNTNCQNFITQNNQHITKLPLSHDPISLSAHFTWELFYFQFNVNRKFIIDNKTKKLSPIIHSANFPIR